MADLDDRTKELLLMGFSIDWRIVEVERLRRTGGNARQIERFEREIAALTRMQDRFRAGEDLPMQDDEDPDLRVTAWRLSDPGRR